jgi:hypothetical protein
MAGAIADAMAAPVETGERHEQQVGIDDFRAGERLGDVHRAGLGRIAGPPEAEGEGRRARDGDRQGGVKTAVGERGEQRQSVRLILDGQKRRGDSGVDPSGDGEALFGKAARKHCADFGSKRAAPPQSFLAQGALAADGIVHLKRSIRNKARGREGRWTVIPGTYVSRWAPYDQVHGQGQGQLPLGSYGPGEKCPDEPHSSAAPM